MSNARRVALVVLLLTGCAQRQAPAQGEAAAPPEAATRPAATAASPRAPAAAAIPAPAAAPAPVSPKREGSAMADETAGDWDPQAAYKASVPKGQAAAGADKAAVLAPKDRARAEATGAAQPTEPAAPAAANKPGSAPAAAAPVGDSARAADVLAPPATKAADGEARQAPRSAGVAQGGAFKKAGGSGGLADGGPAAPPPRTEAAEKKKDTAASNEALLAPDMPGAIGPKHVASDHGGGSREEAKAVATGTGKGGFGNGGLTLARRSGHHGNTGVRAAFAAPHRSDRIYRPLPTPIAWWPKDGRYRSTYLPGRGDLEHLGAFLRRTATPLDAALAQTPLLAGPTLPAPASKSLDVVVDQDRGLLPPDGGVTTLRVRLRATDAAPGPRPPVLLHLVLDSSGSMRGASWTAVCAAVREVARVLQPGDFLSVTHYGDRAEILSAPVPAATPAIQVVAERVCRLKVRGETNIWDGLRLGYQQARSVYDPRAVNRVLLVSDGMATVGPRDLISLTAQTSQALGEGITTSALGVGADFDALLMGRVALEGGGNDHYVRDVTAVPAVLADELDVLARQAAEVVDLRVLLPDDIDLLEVIGSEPLDAAERERVRDVEVRTDQRLARDQGIATDRQRDHDGGVRMLLPSFRLGDEHAILLVVRTPPGRGIRTLAEVELRYKDVLHKRNVRLHGLREVQYADTAPDAQAAQMDDVVAAEARARAAMALQRASEYLDPANLPRIRMELIAAATQVRAAADRTGLADLHSQAGRLRALAEATNAPLGNRQPYLAAALHYQWRLSGGATLWR